MNTQPINRFKFILMLFLLSIAFINCDKTTIVNPKESSDSFNEKINGDVSFIIENNDGNKIENAEVSMGEFIQKSNENGLVIFKNVRMGSYNFTVSKEGYSDEIGSISLDVAVSDEYSIAPNFSKLILLSKLNGVIKGQVLLSDLDGNTYPASQISIFIYRMRYSNRDAENSGDPSIYYSQFVDSVKTDNFGNYIASELPSNENLFFKIKTTNINGKNFLEKKWYTSTKLNGDTVTAFPMKLNAGSDKYLYLKGNNLKNLTQDTPAIFKFSAAIDSQLFSTNNVVLKSLAKNILFKVSLTENNSAISILPFEGKWELGESYVVQLSNIRSLEGGLFNMDKNSFSFSIGKLQPIGKIWYEVSYSSDISLIDYNTSSVIINWEKTQGATQYKIYSKTPEDSHFKFEQITQNLKYTLSLSPYREFLSGEGLQIMVAAENEKESASDENSIILLKDNVGPKLSFPTSIGSLTGKNISTSEQTVNVGYFSFPEPMDTTYFPLISIIEGGLDYSSKGDANFKLPISKIKMDWTNTTRLNVSAILPGPSNSINDTLLLDFSITKDKAGNNTDFSDSNTGAIGNSIRKYVFKY